MTEKEKMISGHLYDASDPELMADREYAKGLFYEINALHPSLKEERLALFKKLLGRTGSKFLIEQPFYCDYGYNISIGENFYSNMCITILDCAPVIIGDNVMIAPNVGIYTAAHPVEADRRNSGMEYALPVTIGNNVWIGANSVILPGVEIGENTVIGAGSVVTKSIPANTIAVGNPCRVLKEIPPESCS
ncbi:MAG: sugar O-acetyltransferase [Odoribacter sp.]|nr:sugar O-acetyltransferase [Odoribacter sp.]